MASHWESLGAVGVNFPTNHRGDAGSHQMAQHIEDGVPRRRVVVRGGGAVRADHKSAGGFRKLRHFLVRHQKHEHAPRVPKFRYLSESKRNFSEMLEKLNSESKFRYLIVDKFK